MNSDFENVVRIGDDIVLVTVYGFKFSHVVFRDIIYYMDESKLYTYGIETHVDINTNQEFRL